MADIDRREFMHTLAALAAAQIAARPATGTAQTARPVIPADTLIGIQMGPHTLLDEGIAPALDLIQETAGINALLTYSHAFHSDLRKPERYLAPDHGKPPRGERSRLPSVWVRHHDQYFRNTKLRVRATDPTLEYANRDLFIEMQKPARERGMKVYARILESSGSSIEGFNDVVTIDINGRPTRTGSWRNPDYKEFWSAVAEDLFRSYDLDGFQWGAERMGPLMNVILPWNDAPPTCFCQHCLVNGRANGIDPDRAREGYTKLFTFVRGLIAGEPKPAEGVFTVFPAAPRPLSGDPGLGVPVPPWPGSRDEGHVRHHQGDQTIGTGRLACRSPAFQLGRDLSRGDELRGNGAVLGLHQVHRLSRCARAAHPLLVPRATQEHRAERADPRAVARSVLRRVRLRQVEGAQRRAARDPGLLAGLRVSRDEAQRGIRERQDKIYPGIGFDVPWGNAHMPADPEEVYQATLKAFEAGAAGIVVSREYEEMRVPNLRAVGRAVRELIRAD